MTNTDENPTTAQSVSDEERRAQNLRRYRNAESFIAEYLELKARQLLARQHATPDQTASLSREVGGAVLSIQRIKEMNDHDTKPTADDDADAIERKRAAFIRYADAVRAELERQAEARRNAETGAAEDPRK